MDKVDQYNAIIYDCWARSFREDHAVEMVFSVMNTKLSNSYVLERYRFHDFDMENYFRETARYVSAPLEDLEF